ncbi:MAG: hypothetical protein PVJ21_23075 [Anaerolineales bacterium]
MSLFDFFKKSNKKQQGSEADNEELFSPEKNKKRYEVAMDFMQYFQEKTPLLNGRPHAGTVLSIAARLAGTSLFRSINKQNVQPGVVVLSEEVNTVYPKLLNLFAYFCKQNGIDVMAKPLVQEIPQQDKPLMELDQIQTEYQQDYYRIMEKHGLDYLESAQAGMIICSMFFNYHCIKNKDIDPYVATGIVAKGVVEGAKTSPVPMKSEGQSKPSDQDKKQTEAAQLVKTIAESSLSGSGERLVLGEKFTAMKEAMDNGGKYILAHPEVENKLQQSGINPYVVYHTALTQELESQIPQIDFVGTDADEMAQEWGDKPQDQAPLHIRQLQWLKVNAEKFGYQQNGNSWKLKG